MDCWNELGDLLQDWANRTDSKFDKTEYPLVKGAFTIQTGDPTLYNHISSATDLAALDAVTLRSILKDLKLYVPALSAPGPTHPTDPAPCGLSAATLGIFKALRTELSRPEHARAALESKLDAYLAQWYFATASIGYAVLAGMSSCFLCM